METLVVLALHKAEMGELGRDQVLRFTHDQFREVAEARHPDVSWGKAGSDGKRDNRELKRQKDKWVDRRDGRRASKASLLREVRVGHREVGEAVGVPSEYELTGLLDLLARARPTPGDSDEGEHARPGESGR